LDLLKEIVKDFIKPVSPDFKPGDTVKVFVKIKEGDKERIQPFQGVITRIKGGGINQTFTVRKISYSVGIERTFFYNSPNVGKIEIIRKGCVRRSRLYYLRELSGKSAKVKEKKLRLVN
jgi:large subunit ribosomal protein L19